MSVDSFLIVIGMAAYGFFGWHLQLEQGHDNIRDAWPYILCFCGAFVMQIIALCSPDESLIKLVTNLVRSIGRKK